MSCQRLGKDDETAKGRLTTRRRIASWKCCTCRTLSLFFSSGAHAPAPAPAPGPASAPAGPGHGPGPARDRDEGRDRESAAHPRRRPCHGSGAAPLWLAEASCGWGPVGERRRAFTVRTRKSGPLAAMRRDRGPESTRGRARGYRVGRGKETAARQTSWTRTGLGEHSRPDNVDKGRGSGRGSGR